MAAGQWSSLPSEGVKTWKKTREQDFVLCPPERSGEAMDVEADSDVTWSEQPLLEALFQQALDWLVPQEPTAVEQIRRGIEAMFVQFPLYVAEFRMVAERLAAAARHLVTDEAMTLWQPLGHAVVLQILDEFARCFDSCIFLVDDAIEEREVSISAELLLDPKTWEFPTTPICEGKRLLISGTVQGTGCLEMRESMTFREAIQHFELTRWLEFSIVCLMLPGCLEEEKYLEVRSKWLSSLQCDGQCDWLLVLQQAACYVAHGGRLVLKAPSTFWQSELVCPFRSAFVSPLS